MATNGDGQWWKTEEIYRSKKQGFWRIKQGSDGNWTEIGRPKVTDIDYNIVAPFIYLTFVLLFHFAIFSYHFKILVWILFHKGCKSRHEHS